MQILQANTAVDVLIGPFVDSTDGNTAETGLTIAQADVRLSKNGQNMAQKNDNTSCVHDELGYYNCELDATDTNTEGTLVLTVHESGALPVRHEFMVVAQAAYVSMFTAKDTGFMDINLKAVSEDTTAADNLESACDNYSATRGLSGTALPAAAADAAGGLPISDAGGLDLDTMDSNVSDILTDTGTTIPATLTDMAGATFATGTDSLEAIRNRGDAAWTTGAGGTPPHLLQNTTIATLASQTSFTLTDGSADDDAYNGGVIVVTDQSTSTQKAYGSISDYTGSTKTVTLDADPGIFTMAAGDTVDIMTPLGAAGGGATAADVWTYGTRVLTAGTNLNDLSATDVEDAVWDAAIADHLDADSTGEWLDFAAAEEYHGKIWIDTVNGTAGTDPAINGSSDYPVDTLADAITLAGLTGYSVFHIMPGSVITLSQTFSNWLFLGEGWTLQLNSQYVGGTVFHGATVTGTAALHNQIFKDCTIGAVILGNHQMTNCYITNVVTMGSNGNAQWVNCWGSNTWAVTEFDFGVGAGTTNLVLENYQGYLAVSNCGNAGTDAAYITGMGELVFNADCDAGTGDVYGSFDITDNSTGTFTLTTDQNYAAASGGDATEAKQDTIITTLGTPADTDMSTDIAAVRLDTNLAIPTILQLMMGPSWGVNDAQDKTKEKIDEMAGATFATGTDSLEAIRDRGDAAWTGGGGDATEAKQDTILARLGAWTGSGNNTILGAFKAALSKVSTAVSDIGGTFDSTTDSQEAIRDRGDSAWITGGTGGGAISWTYTITDSVSSLPIGQVHVWVTTDGAGSNVVASGYTDDFGQVTFELNAGTYYVWRKKAGVDFTNPDAEVVS